VEPPDTEVIDRYVPAPEPYRSLHAGGAPEWLDELDLKPAPPQRRMGTRALDLADWLVVDGLRPAELALRRRLLAERRDDVFAVLPSAEAAAEETGALVRDWLADHGRLPTGHHPADAHPLAAAGLLVQEDLCLMVARDGAWHLDGAILCFPSEWRLGDKLGRPMAAVHAPVTHYADELGDRVDRFFDRLTVDRPVWRRNLFVKATNALFLPVAVPGGPAAAVPGEDGSPYWLRSERQTLRRLPRSGAILFTIRTQLAPLGVLRGRPDRARDLLALIRSRDPGDGSPEIPAVVPWLAAVAAT
jgi:hypothetical protein